VVSGRLFLRAGLLRVFPAPRVFLELGALFFLAVSFFFAALFLGVFFLEARFALVPFFLLLVLLAARLDFVTFLGFFLVAIPAV
jgi:hypothetical protein